MRGAIHYHNTQRNRQAWQAWHTAVLTRTKKMPKLEDLMIDLDSTKKASRKPEPWEMSYEKMNVWAMQSKRKH